MPILPCIGLMVIPGVVAVDDQGDKTARPKAEIEGCQHDEHTCLRGVRDEHLRPVQDVVVAVPLGRRANAGRVAARSRLGERKRSNRSPRRHIWKVPVLVRLRSMHIG